MCVALRRGAIGWIALAVLFSSIAPAAVAEEPAGASSEADRPGALPETENPEKLDHGDNAWMLTSSALVLFMTVPGLAMFYSGLVRKKNVLGVMMQCVFLMGLMAVVWAIYGYSLSFGGDPASEGAPAWSRWIGNDEFLFTRNVEAAWDEQRGEIVVPLEKTIPRLTHMAFQGMFFIITPALICGAFAERMKFSTMVVFMVLWATLVYMPLCHWVWDAGVLAYGAPHAIAGGALDFAGGTVVHISSGVSALVCAVVIGKRLGYGHEPMPPHNLTYTTLGAGMLWVGWFGFNAGSALNAGELASSAFVATHLSAAAGTIGWAGMEWLTRGKPSVLGACSGAVAGLVCITPASGFVTSLPAMAMGLSAGIVCFLACTWLKSKFKYDDSLDVFGVHGVGGTLGAVLTGVFATRALVDPAMTGGRPMGLYEGGSGNLLVGQITAAAITWGLAIVVSFILLKVLDATMGLRVSQQQEIQGLDLSQHGEEGYIFI